MNTIDRLSALRDMIEPTSENLKGGMAYLTPRELEMFLNLYKAALNAEKCLDDVQKRQTNLSDCIADLEKEV